MQWSGCTDPIPVQPGKETVFLEARALGKAARFVRRFRLC